MLIVTFISLHSHSAFFTRPLVSCTQDLENKMREMLSKIYFDKTKDVLNGLRQLNPVDASRQRQLADELNARMAKKASSSLAAE